MNLIILILTISTIIIRIKGNTHIPGNITSLDKCKLSHLGLEYKGFTYRTESYVRCQAWASNVPHTISKSIRDENFPERSKEKARNYCRNPDKNPKGPWCYTMNTDLLDETCAIPLCSFTECKITGPGIEYAGKHNKGISERHCLKWNKHRSKVELEGKLTDIKKFDKVFFPDKDLSKAGKFCRNPNGDPGGPWCFVQNEERDVVEKEYCDIPFCSDPVCVVFTRNYSTYTHFTDFNETLTNLTFGIKIWNSDHYMEASARLVISLLPLPMTAEDMEDIGIALEIFISNNYSALTVNNKDPVEFESTINIFNSSDYTYFSLSWYRGFITFALEGKTKPIFLSEYKTKHNLMGYKMDKFKYYSAQGTNILWAFPFCLDDYECDVHTTSGHFYQQFWPLRETSIGHELIFHIRAVHSAKILMVATPVNDFPNIEIHLKVNNEFSRVIFKEHKNKASSTLKEVVLTEILDYWNWQEFTITFFGDIFQMYWSKSVGTHMIMEVKHEIFRKLRWFSISSENSVAHWTFFCNPQKMSNPPEPFLPECALNEEESNYIGTQDITNTGLPCIPWSAKKNIPNEEISAYKRNETDNFFNYCRDLQNQNKGTYCYTMIIYPDKVIQKTYCRIRKCKSQHCKMAGTGNDYSGNTNITRSGRHCQTWIKSNVTKSRSKYLNNTLFPDLNLDNSNNFCRNPSRDIVGTWCYTDDKNVDEEICLINDCDKTEECTIIISGDNRDQREYILPQWKEKGPKGGLIFALKQWNPDEVVELIIEISSEDTRQVIRLEIGSENNEKLKLYYKGEKVREKTLPHLIPTGRWIDFWLQIRQEEIMLGYKGVPHPLFEWQHPNLVESFEPFYISFSTMSTKFIGIYYKCQDCHTTYCMSNSWGKIYPIGLWSTVEEKKYTNISFRMRGYGVGWMPLYNKLLTGTYYLLELNEHRNKIILYRHYKFKISTLKEIKIKNLFDKKLWNNFTLSFNETDLTFIKNNNIIFSAKSTEPFLIYYFSFGADGFIAWSANCEFLDIDASPRDGGWSSWSEWQCSVKCGGGDGFRTRTCTNPRPNIKGKLCLGSPIMTGRCNEYECGDVSPETLIKIRGKLQDEHFELIVKEGSRAVLRNDKEMLKIIFKESPKSFYEWTLNGLIVETIQDRILFNDDNIIIRNAIPEDSGIYVCSVFRLNNKRIVLRVISLAVIPNEYSIVTRATRPLIIHCKASILGYIYSDLSLKWILNNTIYKDYGIVMLAAADIHKFNKLKVENTGVWKCVVQQEDLRFNWTTNCMKILVRKAPNLYTNLMEDELTAPLFGWLKSERNVFIALVSLVCMTIVCVILGTVIYFTFCTYNRRSYKRNRRLD